MHKWILVPAVQGSEEIARTLQDQASKIVLVYVVDSNANTSTASVGTEIRKAEDRMDRIKKELSGKEIVVKDYVEWGSWPDKLKAIAAIEKCDEIIVPRNQETLWLRRTLKKAGLEVKEA